MRNIIYFLKLAKLVSYLSIINLLYYNSPERKWNKIRKTLQNLGPIFIKLGQTLSSRPDLIGTEPAKELAILQDKLPAFSFQQVKKMIQKELENPLEAIFSYFEEMPHAAASIAQVHKAIIHDGQTVAVKVLRPNIEKLFKKDINFLFWIAYFIDRNFQKAKRLKLPEIVTLLQETVKFELDLRLEAAAASELQENNARHNTIYIPQVLWQFTTEKIMTLEWVDGISVGNKEALIKAGYNLEKICQDLATSFFYQAYQDGFFHADLHPGNIIVRKEGGLALIDFGIMGRLDHPTRLYIAEILHAFLKRDYHRVAEIHFEAGYIPSHKSIKLFTQACRAIGEPIVGLPTNQISVGKLLSQLFKVTATFDMEIQIDLIMLQKTTLLVEGVGMQLSPNLNLWKLAEPWIAKWAVKNISPEARIVHSVKHFIKHFPQSVKKLRTTEVIVNHPPQHHNKINIIHIFLISLITSIFTYYIFS
jgi:ubiquinone biosynthesis protein